MIALTKRTPSSAPATLLPGEYALHSFTTSGVGTNDSPWDGNSALAGVKAAIGAKGGKVLVPVGAFRVTQPVNFTEASIQFKGTVAGFPRDPNASQRGDRGTRFFVAGTFLKVGDGAGERIGNMGFEEIYAHGDNMNDPSSTCFDIVGRIDQAKFTRNVISGFYKAYNVNPTGNANLDTVYFDNENVLYCFHAFYDDNKLLDCFPQFRGGCFSDTPGYGIYFARNRDVSALPRSVVIDGMTLVRNNYKGGSASVHYAGNRLRLVNCTIEDTGLDFLSNGYAPNAHAVIINGDYNFIGGNTICGTATGNAVTVSGYNNTIESNVLWGANGLSDNGNTRLTTGVSSNRLDYLITSDAYDTVINQAGTFTFTDNGHRTIINGRSRNNGHPTQAGDWANHAKPEWLIIHDYLNDKYYEFSKTYSGGYIEIRSAAGSTAPATPSGTTAPNGYRGLVAPESGTNRVEAPRADGAQPDYEPPYMVLSRGFVDGDGAGPSGGHFLYSNEQTAYAEFKGYFRRLTYITAQSQAGGDFTMTINGGSPVTLNNYSSNQVVSFQVGYDSGLLPQGENVVRFDRVTGAAFYFDAIDISNS